jgi:hypothetical protein
MAKKRRLHKTQEDFKKFFGDAKTRLQQLGKETSIWMKKGEVELSRLSKIGKLEVDIVNLRIKKEKLFRNIGRRIVEQNLDEDIRDKMIQNMCVKTKSVIGESKKKQQEISRVGKRFLKSKPTRSSKKK